jgi:hypothetical protein
LGKREKLFGLGGVKLHKLSALCGSPVRGILAAEETGLTFRPMMLPVLTTLLSVLGCTSLRPLPSAGKSAPEQFVVRASQYAFTTNFEFARDHALVEDLLGLRDAVVETLSLPTGTKLIRVVIFESSEAYATYLNDNYPDLPKRRAFFIQQGDDLVILTRLGDDLKEDLRHEAVHALIHSVLPSTPLWLDEGLAEYFEVGPSRESGNPRHIAALKAAAVKGWNPDLDRLERMHDLGQMSAADYRESWLWVHYLLHHSPETKRLLVEHLVALRRGEKRTLMEKFKTVDPTIDAGILEHLTSLSAEGLPPSEDFYPRHPVGPLGAMKRFLER